MKTLTNLILLLVLFLKGSNGSLLVCDKDWEVYKEESCFKVIETVMNYEKAEKTCAHQASGGHLAIIKIDEMQKFLNNYLFRQKKVANDVWIGGKFNSSSHHFNWNNGKSFDGYNYTNWASGSPKNLPKYCVQLFAEKNLAGKWGDEQCSRLNLALCEKPQSWSLATFQEKFLNLKEEVKALKANPVPLGFIYVQLPKEKSPEMVWPVNQWTEVTAAYAGVFFRAEGRGSEVFGAEQDENSRQISKIEYTYTTETELFYSNVLTTAKEGHFTVKTGVFDVKSYGAQTGFKVDVTGGELRPRNMAVKIWKRTA